MIEVKNRGMTGLVKAYRDASPAARRFALWSALSCIVMVAALIVASGRIFTVATGVGDLINYFELTRNILDAASLSEFLNAAFTVAPLFPLSLAAIMHGLGASWLYLLNPLLTLVLLGFLWMFGFRSHRENAVAGSCLAMVGCAWLLFGHPQFVYFMLYPFREAMTFVFLLAGFTFVVLRIEEGTWKRWLADCAAGGMLVMASAVREPAVFGMLGILAYRFMQPAQSKWQRASRVVAIVLPLMVAAMVAMSLAYWKGSFGTHQFAGWKAWVSETTFSQWQVMLLAYLRETFHVLGWPGVCLLLLGTGGLACRDRPLLMMFVVPFTVTLLFYAMFAVYPRYVLSFCIFLLPLMGEGLRMLVVSCDAWVSRHGRQRMACLMYAVFFLTLPVWSLAMASRLQPWGGRVMPRHVRDLHEILDKVRTDPVPVLIESRSRVLQDVLITHLNVPVSMHVPTAEALNLTRYLYFAPANQTAVIQAQVRTMPVTMADRIRYLADLHALTDEDETPLQVQLGDSLFALFQVAAWDQQRIEYPLENLFATNGLAWFDFQRSRSTQPRRAKLFDQNDRPLATWDLGTSSGLVPLYVRPEYRDNPSWTLRIISDQPFPAELRVDSERGGTHGFFHVNKGRLPSILQWLRPPVYINDHEKWGGVFIDAAEWAVPVPRGDPVASRKLVIHLQPRFHESGEAVFLYTVGEGRPSYGATNRLDQGEFIHSITLPEATSGQTQSVLLKVTLPENSQNFFRLARLGLVVEEESGDIE